jgi:hypothetical protein
LLHRDEDLLGYRLPFDGIEALGLEGEQRVGKLSRLFEIARGRALPLALREQERVPLARDLERPLEREHFGDADGLGIRGQRERDQKKKRTGQSSHGTSTENSWEHFTPRAG